ncbi:hypothetical protein LINPERPRIM_LOCUS35882 [Linum perenne]
MTAFDALRKAEERRGLRKIGVGDGFDLRSEGRSVNRGVEGQHWRRGNDLKPLDEQELKSSIRKSLSFRGSPVSFSNGFRVKEEEERDAIWETVNRRPAIGGLI